MPDDKLNSTVTITQNDADIANDVCSAVTSKIGHGDYWPVYGLHRADLFNIVAVRVAMERLKDAK